ncbi:ribosome small subunit-dependent GTPase A [Actinocrinis puniceicyclus]|uniref:Small ribosomal subunit biogenesis GTPase RsgA n=1 Tax=Actinocrinis puniceicyclus TaxID=977794 RepID=A0A8J8BEL7_9ACTN|nr:ribosome small subunit-dependent GTPase A [Actinocrinis puniceicyclus]MBS2963879.1 ribosome small subunit-dependent GTPase A [Actinocrinis puniceicyclus]
MVRQGRDFDEDDVRIRANPRGSRPRSRLRPGHLDAAEAMVLAVDRGRYTCLIDLDTVHETDSEGANPDGSPRGHRERTRRSRRDPGRVSQAGTREVVAMKARELGRKGVVVGDRVSLVGELRGGPDALARVVRVHPREHVLRRTADDTDPVERIIVANADQLVIVTALADPEPRPRMIDRCLVAAYDAGLSPLLCLTKADLADPAPLLAAYSALGVPAIVTQHGGSLRPLHEALAGRVSVLVGHSGVGKSTLVNALVPDADRAIGHVNDVTGRGRHTSTSAVALRLPEYSPTRTEPAPRDDAGSDGPSRRARSASAGEHGPWTQPILFDDEELEELREHRPHAPYGGWVVDTPGVRSFGLAHVSPDRVMQAFPDLAAVIAQCPRGCTHAADAPDCALDEWLSGLPQGSTEHTGATARVDSVRRLLIALTDRSDGAY